MYLPTTEDQKEPIVTDAAQEESTGSSSYYFGSMMTNVCTSIGSRFKTMQVPSVSITSIFKYSTQTATDSNEIPYAMAFDGPSDAMKEQECAICMGKLRYKPQL